jgi:hypothetical protein
MCFKINISLGLFRHIYTTASFGFTKTVIRWVISNTRESSKIKLPTSENGSDGNILNIR